MKYKFKLYENYTKKLLRTPSRLVLTLSGLVLSIIILMLGLIFSETYMDSKLSAINTYKDNSAFVVEGEVEYELYNNLVATDKYPCNIDLISRYKYDVGDLSVGEKNVKLFVKDVRTNNLFLDFLSCGEEDAQRYNARLVKGRIINKEDIENLSKVVVIGENLAKFIFGNDNAIGRTITFPVYKYDEEHGVMQVDYYEELEVIGVISDSSIIEENINVAMDENSDITEIDFHIYTPLSFIPLNRTVDDYNMRVTKYSEPDNYKDNVAIYEEIVWQSGENFATTSYYSLKESIKTEIEEIRQIILYIVIFMFIVSGLCIVNTMFFSVKERINEIGIRKAIGAFDEDIIAQFIFEGLIYGIIGAIIGVVLSVIISSVSFILIGGYEFFDTKLIVSPNVILLATLVSVVIGVLSGIIPSIYAAKIKITQAINYE